MTINTNSLGNDIYEVIRAHHPNLTNFSPADVVDITIALADNFAGFLALANEKRGTPAVNIIAKVFGDRIGEQMEKIEKRVDELQRETVANA